MAAGQSEINSFMSKFYQLLQSGENAQLTLECYNGQFYVNLRASLPHYPHQQFHEHHQHHRQQVPSPSRLRRRARRAAAHNAKAFTTKASHQATSSDNTTNDDNQTQTPAKKVDVAVQATENLVPASSEVAVQASLCETPQFENIVPGNYVGQFAEPPSPILHPYPKNDPHPVQEQPDHDHGLTTEQVVHSEPAVLSADAHQTGQAFLPHPHSPYPHKTHPGRYNHCCDHRCNTGRRRTNSGKRITDERLCCDHRCS